MYGSSPHWRNKARAEVMGFVFQQFQLIPYLTVYENIALPSVAKPIVNEKTKTDALIRRFGLEKRAHHFSDALSTGEKQRVAMARAFFNNPKLILADEPTGNLDDFNAKAVLDYLKEFVEHGGAALLVTHDSRAAAYADKKHRIMNGIME
jgi:ABC-type lipoprotein export system ATPase subunit